MPVSDTDSGLERSNVIKNFFAGAMGGMCTVVAGHPLDLIKLRLQTQPNSPPIYNGTFHCLLKIVKHEGLRGLYKGMLAPLVAAAPLSALLFFGYGVGRNFFSTNPNGTLSYFQTFNAGLFAGFLTTTINVPIERVKCLLQIQANERDKKYSGPVDCLKQLYRTGGVRSLYKGALATSLRFGPPTGVFFVTYELLLDAMTAPGHKRDLFNPLKISLAGGVAGISYWLVGIVPDTLKSRQQTCPEGIYPSLISVYRDLVRKEGHRALFKGLIPVLIRSFPSNAVCLVGFELTLHLLNILIPNRTLTESRNFR